ncbi:MAG TPA: LLM class F420-dependent oxidoreductase [Micromonosporaceae bacterium]
MRLFIFIEPHRGATYHDQARVAQRVEEGGFEGFFRADHYMAFGEEQRLPGPTDAWLTLAGLALQTSRIRLGTLVTSATFRLPAALAISVAQVDQMSGGRVELGLGAGWYEREHVSYGIPFPGVSERFDRLTEQLEIVTGLWKTPPGDRYSFHGEHYRLVDAPALPKPVQRPGPPVIVGGRGPKRTPELAARFADEYNVPFQSPDVVGKHFDLVREACDRLGREDSGRAPLRYSAGVVVFCGRTQEEVRRRSAIMYEKSALPSEYHVAGSPAEVVDRLGAYAEIGASRLYLRIGDVTDPDYLDHLDLIASEVLPQVQTG